MTKYQIPGLVKFRSEIFGGVVQTDQGIFLLNQEEYEALQRFQSPQPRDQLSDIETKLLEIGAISPSD